MWSIFIKSPRLPTSNEINVSFPFINKLVSSFTVSLDGIFSVKSIISFPTPPIIVSAPSPP